MRKALIAAALVALAACAQQIVPSPAVAVPHAKAFKPPPSWGLFVRGPETPTGSWQLTQLDAGTLSDRRAGPTGQGNAIVSADASTIAELDYTGQRVAVRIIDARTGAERTTFRTADGAGPVLTPDGSRLLVLNQDGSLWEVFDTSTGMVVGGLEDSNYPCCNLLDFWVDPTGQFLYRGLVLGSGWTATRPVTPVLVQYDLNARREIRRLTLTGVQAGVWQGPRLIGSEHVSSMLVPGLALSPDGLRISILYSGGSRLITVDTTTMKVVADRPLLARGPARNTFGLASVDAQAKYEEGVQWELAYAQDGSRLVAWATQTSVDDVGNYTHHGLGVKLIDAQTGVITAEAPNLAVDSLFFAPDGSALYATSVQPDANMNLIRIDPTNLAVAATRTFEGTRPILVLAR